MMFLTHCTNSELCSQILTSHFFIHLELPLSKNILRKEFLCLFLYSLIFPFGHTTPISRIKNGLVYFLSTCHLLFVTVGFGELDGRNYLIYMVEPLLH